MQKELFICNFISFLKFHLKSVCYKHFREPFVWVTGVFLCEINVHCFI